MSPKKIERWCQVGGLQKYKTLKVETKSPRNRLKQFTPSSLQSKVHSVHQGRSLRLCFLPTTVKALHYRRSEKDLLQACLHVEHRLHPLLCLVKHAIGQDECFPLHMRITKTHLAAWHASLINKEISKIRMMPTINSTIPSTSCVIWKWHAHNNFCHAHGINKSQKVSQKHHQSTCNRGQ